MLFYLASPCISACGSFRGVVSPITVILFPGEIISVFECAVINLQYNGHGGIMECGSMRYRLA